MNGGSRPLGYTIIEVMIVLAISGVMFLIAANFISGKQAKTSFTEGSNEFVSQVQSVVAEVVDGQYPDDASLGCSAGGSNLTFNSNGTQGNNAPCVFIGKFMHFSVGGNASAYETFSLAAARDKTSLTTAEVTAITPAHSAPTDFTQQGTIPQSLNVKSVKVTDTSGVTHNTWGIGFAQSLGTTTNGFFNSGSQTVGMFYSNALNSGTDNEASADAALTGSHLKVASSAVICLTDGTRTAEVRLGLSGSNDANNAPTAVREVVVC